MTPPKETSNGAALELVETAYLSAEPEPDLSDIISNWPLDYRCDVLSRLGSVGTALKESKRQLAESIESDLGPNNAYRHHDTFYVAAQAGSWNTKKDPANDGTLAEFLGPDWIHAVNLGSNGAVTMTRLKQLTKQRLLAENPEATKEEVAALEKQITKQFFEYKTYGDPVKPVPFDKAKPELQKLEDGATLYPPKRKELGSE